MLELTSTNPVSTVAGLNAVRIMVMTLLVCVI